MKYFLLIILYTLFFAEVSFAQDDEEYSEEYDAIEEIEPNNSVEEYPDSLFVTQIENENTLSEELQEAASEAATVATEGNDFSEEKQKKIHWVPIGIFTGVAAVGGILAYVYDKQAKDATATPPSNANEYQKGYDDSGEYQSMRNISLGITALGLLGIGITFLF